VSPSLAQADLEALDAQVERALQAADPVDLTVLGYGEISCVLLTRSPVSDFACKRLPPFECAGRLEGYRNCFERYLKRLAESGVGPAESELRTIHRPDGRVIAYCVQPAFPPERIGHRYLADCSPSEALLFFDAVLDAVVRCAGETLGLDGQVSNWVIPAGATGAKEARECATRRDDTQEGATGTKERREGDTQGGEVHEGKVRGSGLLYLDVTTPLMRSDQGEELLDTELFMKSLPWALRGLVRRFFFRQILDKYYVPRGVVLDLLGNLYKEGLSRLIPGFLERANERLSEPIGEEEVRAYYQSDAWMWALMQRLRRADRWWQRAIRRRTYPFLLPGEIRRNL
jgi:hypothetical protein